MVVILGRVTGATDEDPFGPGDPLDVARLVRRSLAAAGRKALEVSRLVVVTDAETSPETLARFTRRALGSHGHGVPSSSHASAGHDHEARERLAIDIAQAHASVPGTCVIVVLGPTARASVVCVAVSRSSAGHRDSAEI